MTLSHTGGRGEARMVDVSEKSDTHRVARASGTITMSAETLRAIVDNTLAKGDVLTVARIAGIGAAKRTAELIPLCHNIPLTEVVVDLETDDSLPGIRVTSAAMTVGKTGVEMEALTAVAVALLTIYDMAKSMDRGMIIGDVMLLEKSGGKSGTWKRERAR
ncbi:MAG TPA: cyclic pyranopterin monophosphate synthase MoaC [Gemmatimonadaceae bacterium]|nr:cyclic pyranopterin monophosphate synthase MoaC [Gemmatimonadaceae bacterium]